MTLDLRTLCAAVAFGALNLAPAFADDRADGPLDAVYPDPSRAGLAVRFDDLDLSREGDARALYERLQRAAEAVCAESRRTASPLAEQIARSCTNRSLDRAVSSLGAELVTRLHRS